MCAPGAACLQANTPERPPKAGTSAALPARRNPSAQVRASALNPRTRPQREAAELLVESRFALRSFYLSDFLRLVIKHAPLEKVQQATPEQEAEWMAQQQKLQEEAAAAAAAGAAPGPEEGAAEGAPAGAGEPAGAAAYGGATAAAAA